jgi:hypothetical protein
MTWTSFVRRTLIANFVFLMFVATTTWGQDATGKIIGNVTDQSGAAIADAKVTVRNVATDITQETTSDKDGFYQVLALPIGSYTVTFEHAGFRNQIFERQALQINQSLRLDPKLEIGQQSEVVEVKDQAANVETVNQTVGAPSKVRPFNRRP